MTEEIKSHPHTCQKCGKTWLCTDNSGDGSDMDCRWFTNVICPECHRKYLES